MKTIKIITVLLLCLIYASGFSQDEKITMHAKKFEIDVANPANARLK
ncbi:MAG: hypothetical protein P1P88_13190 [Bacteroidales bacterium]|nr:hypothetical protein [Bacteroidales bacterium]